MHARGSVLCTWSLYPLVCIRSNPAFEPFSRLFLQASQLLFLSLWWEMDDSHHGDPQTAEGCVEDEDQMDDPQIAEGSAEDEALAVFYEARIEM